LTLNRDFRRISITQHIDIAGGRRMNSRQAFAFALVLTGIIGAALAALFLAAPAQPRNWIEVGEGYTIGVPGGFSIERVAAPDDIQYPMMATLDDRGRLFVAESSGKNVKGRDMPAHPECRISLLEDTDGDGRYDRSRVFADALSLPMGALWQGRSLYVASPPDFIRLDDRDGDGVAEHREVILTGWNILNTASLHGPFAGPDGLMYLTHGRHGYKIQTKEGALLEGMAARIWRCREDGSQLERVCGGGFDNPVELIFTPAGEAIGTMTYFIDPQNGQRDSLMHFVEGGVYPKPHPVVGEFKRTGDLMPVMTRFARIAPSGLLQYRGAAFGPEFKGNLFSAQFNPHRIQRHVLHREGATFRTEDSDFVTSTDPDFHPTDVIEDADGSLLFLDTGGWYVDACPLSKISKAERKGAIYRVRKIGALRIDDPRGAKLRLESLPPAELASQLEDARPPVRDRSLELLVAAGEAAVNALANASRQSPSPESRCSAVFALGRIATPAALEAVRAALDDRDFQVRIAAARVAGMTKDRQAVDRLSQMVKGDELPARRQAATSLGQIGEARVVAALLAAAAGVKDRFVEHSIIYSLIQLKDAPSMFAALDAASPQTRKAALIALDQMDDSPLRREQAAPLLDAADADLRRAALWVISRHADWAGAVIEFLRARLQAPKFDAGEAAPVREALLAFAADGQVQSLVAERLRDPATDVERRVFLLETIERCSLKQMPADWIAGVAALLGSSDARVRQRTIALIRARRLEGMNEPLERIAGNPSESSDLRVAAISAVMARKPQLTDAAFDFLRGLLPIGQEPGLRLSAAQCLGQAELSRGQLLALASRVLPQSDPLTLLPLLDAFRAANDEETGQALLAALGRASVNLEAIGGKRIEQLFKNFSDRIRSTTGALLARFEAEEASRVERLRQLEPLLAAGGDVGRGRNLFFGTRAACGSCHTIGAEGGHVGPDLTSVGSIRSGHDILEAIAFPSATMVPGHESRRVMTKTGNQVYSGVISEFESDRDTVVLVSGPNDKLRIPRDEVASITPSNVSLMPDGFATQLTARELTDLLAFLKAQK
jgi:putative membrane-bound dehydrogenase-like protein